MTRSAPMERTKSTFPVLHTPVTSAPKDLAICTANVPTPPPAPLIRTFCPGRIFPLSRRPCNAVRPATGTEAACSNVTLLGLVTNADSRVHTYSARAPLHAPNTSSPGFELGHLPSDRFNLAGHIASRSHPWFAQPECNAKEGRPTSHNVSVKWIEGSRADFDQNLIVSRGRLRSLYTLENIGRAIAAINNGFHKSRGCGSQWLHLGALDHEPQHEYQLSEEGGEGDGGD